MLEAPTHVRSYYTRLVADVPCAGRHVQLLLHVRKFRCDTATCPRKVFAERLDSFVAVWARQTTRPRQAIEAIGLATCGEGGARLADRLGMATSPTTLLRRIMALPLPAVEPVSHLGIDDFALHRGRTYGTVLVDLRRHQVLDLLPDRKAETAQAWMQARPTIELVSRDRGGEYAAAARQGAPQAVQTADRFHLCKNLAEAVEKALARGRPARRTGQPTKETEGALSGETTPAPLVTAHGQPYSAHQPERYERYQQAVTLRRQGMTTNEIARHLGLGRRTVQSWLTHDTYPETRYHTRRQRSRFDAYEAYVRQRWDEGEHTIQHLWREIKAQGYPHSDRALRAHLEAWHGENQAAHPAPSELRQWSAKQAVWLFMRPVEQLKEREREAMVALVQTSSLAQTLYPLVQEFLRMVHTLQGDHLDAWIAQVVASQIKELQRFAKGLEQDKAAVLAGLTRAPSNGQVEGQVTRIKLIKRIMYGRAGFALLRQHVLQAL